MDCCRFNAGLQMIDAGLMLVCCRVNAGLMLVGMLPMTQV